MASKIKNDPSRYVTRAALSGGLLGAKEYKAPRSTRGKRVEVEERDDKGVVDHRWYIQLPPKH